MATVKGRSPTGEWEFIGQPGPLGDTGPTGPLGPTGVMPTGPLLLPGGTAGQALTKLSSTDGDASWAGPHLALTGGTVTGALTVSGNHTINGTLTSPTVGGNVYFNNDISANKVTDRSDYAWEEFFLDQHLAAYWSSDFTIGPCRAWRNAYGVVVNMCLRRDSNWVENAWVDVINPGSLPVGWRPAVDVWESRMAVEIMGSGSLFETLVTSAGNIQVNMKGTTLDWSGNTRTVMFFHYPRAGA